MSHWPLNLFLSALNLSRFFLVNVVFEGWRGSIGRHNAIYLRVSCRCCSPLSLTALDCSSLVSGRGPAVQVCHFFFILFLELISIFMSFNYIAGNLFLLFSPPSDLLFSALIGAVSAPPFLSFKILFCCAGRFFCFPLWSAVIECKKCRRCR